MEEEQPEEKFFASFEKHEQFAGLQESLLSKDLFENPNEETDRHETETLRSLSDILDEYQEQSYLLDPILEGLVTPVAEKLRVHARLMVSNPSRTSSISRVGRIATLLYLYTKFRVRFFPHEVTDVVVALEYMNLPGSGTQEAEQWALRYIVLLWISIICMIPFDLAQFNDGTNEVSSQIEDVAKMHLAKAGLERDGAAILLSRLYIRKDVSGQFPRFLSDTQSGVEGTADIFKCIGALKVVAEILKIGSAEQARDNAPSIWSLFRAIETKEALMNNTLVRKLRSKVLSRTALRLLPAKYQIVRLKGRSLLGTSDEPRSDNGDGDPDIPEDVEAAIEELMQALQDKVSRGIQDTVVRWSAAKGVARIAERLPAEFGKQIFDGVLELFAIHSMAAANLYDLPAIAECTWHGACLACAEIARRGLVPDDKLTQLVGRLSQALSFDIRKGSHSIGSNVRDAATYVLWSLARAQKASALTPLAEGLAQKLVTVSLYDREVQVRRAASAAFQEYVGRTGLFPHGIDVLRKTDFYAVGVRRNAYLVAAPEVAEHPIYRTSLIDHILSVSLRHWDPVVRQLSSQSLKAICELDLVTLGPSTASRASNLLRSVDVDHINGGLLALAELAAAYDSISAIPERDARKREVFAYLNLVPLHAIQAPRNTPVTTAACYLISTAITSGEIHDTAVPHWKEIIDTGLRHRDSTVQEHAANALASVSRLVDCSVSSLGTLLGVLDYKAYPHNMPDVIQEIYSALKDGLDDYTVDQRGDVGSWIRMASVKGLTEVSSLLLTHGDALPTLEEYLPPALYHEAIGGILKQGVERLDNVRQTAGEYFIQLLSHPLPPVQNADAWRIDGEDLFKRLFLAYEHLRRRDWKDSTWLFPMAVQILGVTRYRKQVLAGLVLSVGSKTDSTQRPVSQSLVKYAEGLPVSAGEGDHYALQTLVEDLLNQIKANPGSNNAVIPALQTLTVLLEAETLARLQDVPDGLDT
ncbi:hypothetical protein GLOTRDRAFT_42674 [Gloeophyllum trabeum ATCC 11539]|uniref:Uncharacterized protein n=1 Tax=Gloeophyllum trabeum (strain ATCC 11539 / FP-39264 / Madison 617) TaxID=670483 RepID=S7Q4T6_GLOTA|nr:uncharacterized protein GLOTRDRAFT_42674 [Gloeophyllum trabeum ATCC 11539]EPQ54507.1 hypothetical protein GLOTRDRAFT_42674 [Gloeophyllum trabeum ATCC 11539]